MMNLTGFNMKLEELINRACLGDSAAEYELGSIYCIREDIDSAISWLNRAKKHKHSRAEEFLNEVLEVSIHIQNSRRR
jgi:hypothetical protein